MRKQMSLKGSAFAFFGAAAVTSVFAAMAFRVPLVVSGALMLASVIAGLIACTRRRIGPITLFSHIVFCVPFVHLIPYIFDVPPSDPPLLWGLVPNPAMFDLVAIGFTAVLGAVGSSAFASGYLFNAWQKPFEHPKFQFAGSQPAAAPLWMSLLLLAASMGIAILSAPKKTIFEAVYTGEGSVADSINFNSAWLVAAALLLLVLADAIADHSIMRARIKAALFLLCSLYYVVWLQFARGDREMLFFVFASGYLTWVWGAPQFARSVTSRRLIQAASVAGVVLTLGAGFMIQKYRSELAPDAASLARAPIDKMPSREAMSRKKTTLQPGGSLSDVPPGWYFKLIDIRIPNGTWSAVLLTPLSVAEAETQGDLNRLWGRTYKDLVLSLPPGFVADRLGYERPIDAKNGPAHQQKYGLGGTHAVVVPMMNFGLTGVLLISAIIGFLISALERWGTTSASNHWATGSLFAQGLLITILPHWLWYGEKVFLTAILISILLLGLYRVVVFNLGTSMPPGIQKAS